MDYKNRIATPRLTSLCYIERNGCWLVMHRTKREGDENRDTSSSAMKARSSSTTASADRQPRPILRGKMRGSLRGGLDFVRTVISPRRI